MSTWYNGPWTYVDPYEVPLFILRVPVRYYRDPPRYFHGWRRNKPPRWGEHWGRDWRNCKHGWDHWNHRESPARAPLTDYQRHYVGDLYPRGVARQTELTGDHYRYAPRDSYSRQCYVEGGRDHQDEYEQDGGGWRGRASGSGRWDRRGGGHRGGHGRGR